MDVALAASIVTPIRPAAANGPHAIITDLARGLLRRGHQVSVYAAAGSQLPGVPLVEIEVDPAVRGSVIRPDHLELPANQAVRAGFERLAGALRRRAPDVVSQHAFDAEAIELLADLPILHTLHLPPMVPAVVDALRRTDAPLATVSHAAERQWRRVLGRDLLVLPNGVPDHAVAPEQASLPSRVEPHAVIAGRISPEKGTHLAIRAACRAGLRPILVGDIYDADYYAREVEPLLDDVTFLGPRTRRGLSVLLAHSAALVMASQWDETFGLVAAEAQMAGCPVVAFRRGALPEVVSHGRGGWLVEPGDLDGLTDALFELDGFDRQAIRADARRRLGLEPMIDAYEAALGSVAAAGSRRVA
jgi:glycosyltransferase involved in cell wall biosynthesis